MRTSSTPRWGFTGLTISITIACLVWALRTGGLLESLDGLCYDRIVYLVSLWRQSAPDVLLIALDRDEILNDSRAFPLIERLREAGVRRVVFNYLPRQVSAHFYQAAALQTNVWFGRRVEPSPDDPEVLVWQKLPEGASEETLRIGAVQIPPGLDGIYRRDNAWVMLGTNRYPSLPAVMAWSASQDASRSNSGPTFLVDFVGPPGSMPKLTLDRVLAGELIPEIAHGKTILVGLAGADIPGVYVPVSRGQEMMSLLEFQANSIQTVMRGTAITELGRGQLLVWLAAMGVVSSLVYQRIGAFASCRVTLEFLVVHVLSALVGIGFFRVWIGLGALLLAQALQFIITLAFKIRLTSLAMNEIRLHSLARLKARFSPENFYYSPQYWDFVVSMIHQTLDLQRMVFFEQDRTKDRLCEMKAVNCGFEDVLERERRIQESPFAEAIATRSPVRVFNFLRPTDTAEDQYLCPLQFAGDVLGMWVFSVDPMRSVAIPQFDLILVEFSQQIARLLYQKKRAQSPPSVWRRLKEWFTLERENRTYQELNGTARLLEQYYSVLESLVRGITTATVVYDLFGRVLSVNEKMRQLLDADDFRPTQRTPLELLGHLTRQDETQSRQVLRHVILDKATVSFPVKLEAQPEHQFLLRLYPLEGDEGGQDGPEPFRQKGLVGELIDITAFSNLASLKGMIAERLGVQLRNDFAAIDMAACLLETSETPDVERQKLLALIHERIGQAVDVIAECQKYLDKDIGTYGRECYPLDAHGLFNQVCDQFRSLADQKRIRFEITQPRLMNHVLGSTEDLKKLFSAIFNLLLEDAAEDTALTVLVETEPSWVTFRFDNCGFGIPNERLQEILTGTDPVTLEDYRTLRKAISWLHNWGGALEIVSGVGRGYQIALTLRQFM